MRQPFVRITRVGHKEVRGGERGKGSFEAGPATRIDPGCVEGGLYGVVIGERLDKRDEFLGAQEVQASIAVVVRGAPKGSGRSATCSCRRYARSASKTAAVTNAGSWRAHAVDGDLLDEQFFLDEFRRRPPGPRRRRCRMRR